MHAAAFAAGSRVPNVDVDERNVGVSSAAAAVAVLRTSADHGDRYWCAFVAEEAIRHPPWWPAAAMADAHARTGRGPLSVPTYDQIIVGSGATGIGCHIDQVGGRPVNTELTIARGRKRVLLLPPREGDALLAELPTAFPAAPSPELVARIVAVGGFVGRAASGLGGSPVCCRSLHSPPPAGICLTWRLLARVRT
jgi:hypothetical protein